MKYYIDKQFYGTKDIDGTIISFSYESDIVDGKYFKTYEEAEKYAEKINYRLNDNEIYVIMEL